MIRYFRASAASYLSICEQLDAAYAYPRQETLTDRTLPAVESLPQDSEGRVYLAVSAGYCEFVLPSQLLASGVAEEISAGQYQAVLPEVRD